MEGVLGSPDIFEGYELTNAYSQRLYDVLEFECVRIYTRKRPHIPLISLWE